MVRINFKGNKLIKSAKKLITEKKYRDLTNLFVAESYRIITTLMQNNISLRNLIVSQESRYFQAAKTLDQKGINVVVLPPNLFNTLSSLATSDGWIGIFNKPKKKFNLSQNGKYVLLNKIQNPGNLGSIIRTAACFNIDGIIISNDSVDLYHPSIIRATMGSCFSLPIKIVTNLADTIEQMKKYGIMILGTALTSQTKELKQVSIANRAFAVIFGNEGQGLSEVILKMCDEVISIPIDRKKIDSLNVSVSAGIILYHLCNGS